MRLICGETRSELAVHAAADGLRVSVDGRSHAVDVEEAGPGTFVLRDGDRRETFHCVRDGDVVHLFWRGAGYRLLLEREGARPSQRAAAGGLEAPMPGRVIKVNAAPGQRVARGEEMLVIEAMKMENAVRAPRDGVVKAVAARVGDMVAPGVTLVELEAE